MENSQITVNLLEEKLKNELNPEFCEIKDVSDGCGYKFEVLIVSNKFEGFNLLKRHRLVNSILKSELEIIHAFSQKTLTPQEWESKQS